MANIAAQAALGTPGASAQSVINQGIFGGGGISNIAQQLANQQLANQGITPMNQTPAITSGVSAAQQAVLNAQNFVQQGGANMAEQAGLDAAVEAGGNPYADDESNMITAGMAVGAAPVATAGNFNPQTQFAAQRMFGRQKFRRKPLITF